MRTLSVRAVVMQDGKLLCCKLKNYQGAIEGDFWCLPGGGVDDGEAVLPALTREITEETGVTPQIGKLLYVHQFKAGDNDALELFFHVTNAQDLLSVDLAKSSHGQDEIAEMDFIDPKAERILPEFLTTEPIEQQIDSSQPAKIFSY